MLILRQLPLLYASAADFAAHAAAFFRFTPMSAHTPMLLMAAFFLRAITPLMMPR